MRKRFRTIAYALVIAGLSIGRPAVAQEAGIAFKPAVDTVIDTFILPGYRQLAASSAAMDRAMTALCDAPDEAGLAEAQDAFRDLVVRWSTVELIRFGPVREDNRYERLFFWPDRKGLGLRQVQRILGEEDPTATAVDSLRDKSVAVQGLIALEYLLFGTGFEELAGSDDGTFRCDYGRTVAAAIALTTQNILDDWEDDGGYPDLMRNAGPDDPIYRSHGEVVQQILKSAREEAELVRNLKLARPLGKSAKAANPKAAPFWRSNSVVATVNANLESVGLIIETGGVGDLLPETDRWLGPSLVFELNQAQSAIAEAGVGPWIEVVRDEAIYQRLTYALLPLGGAHNILENQIPTALGLITGFNSLDGD